MKRLRTLLLSVLAPASLLAAASCAEPARSPLAPEQPRMSSTTTGATLLECPTDVTRSVSGTIDLLGGTLELDGHRLVIPANAVLLPTTFTLTVPASNYVKIQVTAGGEEHYQFNAPVSLSISYERCTRSNTDKKTLVVWYVSGDTLLENMGGTDDKTARRVTTTTDHLSDYALGTP